MISAEQLRSIVEAATEQGRKITPQSRASIRIVLSTLQRLHGGLNTPQVAP